ncbi:Uncharacterised protein [Mycobacteroides abscessus subsp. massiliense]|nr:Uncharacterised protein [Mycobacteroides abscessus subsp. massiliense]
MKLIIFHNGQFFVGLIEYQKKQKLFLDLSTIKYYN